MRYVIIFSICLSTLFSSFFLYRFLQDEFNLNNISYELAAPPADDFALFSQPPKEIQEILAKPFFYLGKGHQTYAFVSQDQDYVLKFIKFTYLKTSFIDKLPNTFPFTQFKLRHEKWKQKRFLRIFAGYRLAFEKDADNTGLVWTHLSKTKNLYNQIVVKDRYGLKHPIDLDNTFFILQRKAVMTKDVLKTLLNRHEVETAKLYINHIFELYADEYKKGLTDSDHNVMSNTGFVGNKAIHIDVGRLALNQQMQDSEKFKKDLKKIAHKRFGRWIRAHHPKYYAEILSSIEGKLDEIFNSLNE